MDQFEMTPEIAELAQKIDMLCSGFAGADVCLALACVIVSGCINCAEDSHGKTTPAKELEGFSELAGSVLATALRQDIEPQINDHPWAG